MNSAIEVIWAASRLLRSRRAALTPAVLAHANASDLASGPDPIPSSAAKPPHGRRFPPSVLLATRWWEWVWSRLWSFTFEFVGRASRPR